MKIKTESAIMFGITVVGGVVGMTLLIPAIGVRGCIGLVVLHMSLGLWTDYREWKKEREAKPLSKPEQSS